MFNNPNCLIGRTNLHNLVICKLRKSNVDLKDNLVNNSKNSNADF